MGLVGVRHCFCSTKSTRSRVNESWSIAPASSTADLLFFLHFFVFRYFYKFFARLEVTLEKLKTHFCSYLFFLLNKTFIILSLNWTYRVFVASWPDVSYARYSLTKSLGTCGAWLRRGPCCVDPGLPASYYSLWSLASACQSPIDYNSLSDMAYVVAAALTSPRSLFDRSMRNNVFCWHISIMNNLVMLSVMEQAARSSSLIGIVCSVWKMAAAPSLWMGFSRSTRRTRGTWTNVRLSV